MASLIKRGPSPELPNNYHKNNSSPKPGCWESFCEWCRSICGQGSSSMSGDRAGERNQATQTETTLKDKAQNGTTQHDYANMKGAQHADTKPTIEIDKSNNKQVSSQPNHKQENIFGSNGVGEKKTGTKPPETLRIADKETNTKTSNGLKPGQSLQDMQGTSYGSSTKIRYGIPVVGDRNLGSTLPETLGQSDEDAKMNAGSSFQPGQPMQNQQQQSYGRSTEKRNGSPKMGSTQPQNFGSSYQDTEKRSSIIKPDQSSQNRQSQKYGSSTEKTQENPGVGDWKMASTLLETLASSYQDTKTKTGSSVIPGQSLQNKQENSHRSSAEKSSGSPGVGDSKMSSTQLATFRRTDQDAKTKNDSILKPGLSIQNEQENSYGSSTEKTGGIHEVGDRKMGFIQLESLGTSDQDAKKKTISSLKPGQTLQYEQGNSSLERPVHKSSPKEDDRQVGINKSGKDPNPQKVLNSPLKQSSKEQQKGSLRTENNIESQAKKFCGSNEQAGRPPRNEKQKDVLQPSFKSKDNINVDTGSPKILTISTGYTSAEQPIGVHRQENNTESQPITRLSSPMITNFSSAGQGQGGQFMQKEQQKSITKQEGSDKDDKYKGPNYIDLTGRRIG